MCWRMDGGMYSPSKSPPEGETFDFEFRMFNFEFLSFKSTKSINHFNQRFREEKTLNSHLIIEDHLVCDRYQVLFLNINHSCR
jgi:hypothetical protein